MLNAVIYGLHAILIGGTFALVCQYYGIEWQYDIPVWFEYVIYAGVLGISIGWALMHALVGSVMGVAAGGILDGLKLGLMLGCSLSVGRLWPYMLAGAGASFYSGAPLWHVIVAFLLGLVCLAVYSFTKFVWSH